MVAIVNKQFGGMVPRLGRQTLQPLMAQKAVNCYLVSGELKGVGRPVPLLDLRSQDETVRRAYRYITDDNTFAWILFDDPTVDFLKGSLISDGYNRHYWTSEVDLPRYSTAARIDNNAPPYILGIPSPENKLTITPPPPASVPVSRAYVYTFVSDLGEEGPPSEARVVSGDDVGGWILTNFDTTVPDPDERVVTKKRVYRTVTSTLGTVAYHFVDEIPLEQESYTDAVDTLEVSINSLMESDSWYPPPEDLMGLVNHPNGFLVGFTGRDIYFSVPYRPHAWPPEYVLSTESPIVGLAIFGTSIVVCTHAFPFVITGVRPDSMVFIKVQTPEPCLSRRGIVGVPFGVYYPSPNGLALVSGQGIQIVTEKLISRDDWQRNYLPSFAEAVRYENQYIALTAGNKGFMLSPTEANPFLVELDESWEHEGFMHDEYTADVLFIAGNVVSVWNPSSTQYSTYLWKSKEYDTPTPVNFGAARIIFDRLENTTSEETYYRIDAWNQKRFAAGPLNPLNHHALNSVRYTDPKDGTWPVYPDNSQPFHSSPLFNANLLILSSTSVTFKLYANGRLRFSEPVNSTEMFRLPTGYKATRWAFEVIGNAVVQSVKIAETGRELEKL